MVSSQISRHVEGTPEKVFEVFTDFRNAAENIRGITKLEVLTEGPIGVGTRFRETRVMFKREAVEEMEITGFEPGKSYTMLCESHGARYETVFRFAPDGEGTRVDCVFQVEPISLFAKLMSPLGKMLMGSGQKCVAEDLEDLKKIVEAKARA